MTLQHFSVPDRTFQMLGYLCRTSPPVMRTLNYILQTRKHSSRMRTDSSRGLRGIPYPIDTLPPYTLSQEYPTPWIPYTPDTLSPNTLPPITIFLGYSTTLDTLPPYTLSPEYPTPWIPQPWIPYPPGYPTP